MSTSSKPVTLVIPGRDCAETLRPCLSALAPLLDGPHLREIIFVDDGSVDGSGDIEFKEFNSAVRYVISQLRRKGQLAR